MILKFLEDLGNRLVSWVVAVLHHLKDVTLIEGLDIADLKRASLEKHNSKIQKLSIKNVIKIKALTLSIKSSSLIVTSSMSKPPLALCF